MNFFSVFLSAANDKMEDFIYGNKSIFPYIYEVSERELEAMRKDVSESQANAARAIQYLKLVGEKVDANQQLEMKLINTSKYMANKFETMKMPRREYRKLTAKKKLHPKYLIERSASAIVKEIL
jgi:hypothetical protein